jgi:hypothetical protein
VSGIGRTAIAPRHLFGSGLCPSSVTQPKLFKSAGRALVQLEQFSLHKEQSVGFTDWTGRGGSFREANMAANRRPASKSASDYSPHQRAERPSDLLKILGQELREHYELPHNLPHVMFTLLMELSDRGGSPALRTRADKYRALCREGMKQKRGRRNQRQQGGLVKELTEKIRCPTSSRPFPFPNDETANPSADWANREAN